MKKIILPLLTLISLGAFAGNGNGDVGSVGILDDIRTIIGTGNNTEFGEQTCEISIVAHGASQHTITIRALGLEYSLLANGIDSDSGTVKSKTESIAKDSSHGNSNLFTDTTITFKKGKPVSMTVSMAIKDNRAFGGESEKDSMTCKF